ncbi:LiaF transmembrane domain-containing protein [Viscerimonas tarda]
MAKNSNNYLAYGLTIMLFGLIFLLGRTGILGKIPYCSGLLGIGPFFLIAGVIFLLASAEKVIGIVSTIIGVLIILNDIFGWGHLYSYLLAPILLIVAGVILILTAKF